MVTWEVIYQPERLRETWFIGSGALSASIHDDDLRECRSHADVGRLRAETIAPLVWLAMPCHDDPQPEPWVDVLAHQIGETIGQWHARIVRQADKAVADQFRRDADSFLGHVRGVLS